MSLPGGLYIGVLLLLCSITVVIGLWFYDCRTWGAGCLLTLTASIGNKSEQYNRKR